MLLYSARPDVAGPGLIVALGLGVGAAVLLAVVVVVVEAVVLRVMKWGAFWRSLLGSLLMNIASGVVGLFFIGLGGLIGPIGWVIVTFLASIAIEGGVLALMKREQAGRGFLAALVANVVTYIPVAGLLIWGLNQ
jgi:hypothetical protein